MAQLVFISTAKQDYEKKFSLLSFDSNLRVRSQSKVMIKQGKAESSAGNPMFVFVLIFNHLYQ